MMRTWNKGFAIYHLLLPLLCMSTLVTTVGSLPLGRQRTDDIITGVDFLSLFMKSIEDRFYSTEKTTEIIMSTEKTDVDMYSNTPLIVTQVVTTINEQSKLDSLEYITTTLSGLNDFTDKSSTERHDSIAPVLQSETINSNANKYVLNIEEPKPIIFTRLSQEEDASTEKEIHLRIPKYPTRQRSVSYSSVIQYVPGSFKDYKSDPQNHSEDSSYVDNLTEVNPITTNYYLGHQEDVYKKFKVDQAQKNQTGFASYDSRDKNWEKNLKFGGKHGVYNQPEQNYEVDEAASVLSNGQIHGVQSNAPTEADDNKKIGYVVEGRNYRKYRVEERTSDGFIVGEYGVVSNNDGNLRGVRYTADGTINPSVIYNALMKFLSL